MMYTKHTLLFKAVSLALACVTTTCVAQGTTITNYRDFIKALEKGNVLRDTTFIPALSRETTTFDSTDKVEGTLTVSNSKDSVLTIQNQSGAQKQVNFVGMKNLTFESTNDQKKATLQIDGLSANSQDYGTFVRIGATAQDQVQALRNFTVLAKGKDGAAIAITYKDTNPNTTYQHNYFDIYAKNTTIQSEQSVAVLLEGAKRSGTDVRQASDMSFEALDSARTINFISPSFAIIAQRGGSLFVEGKDATINVTGNIDIHHGSVVSFGSKATEKNPNNLMESVSITGKKNAHIEGINQGDELIGAISLTNTGTMSIRANDVTIDKGDANYALLVSTITVDNDHGTVAAADKNNTIDVYLWGEKSLNINGDILLNGMSDRQNTIEIGSNGKATINGKLEAKNTNVSVTLQGMNSYFEGSFNTIQDKNVRLADTDTINTTSQLSLKDGATFKATATSEIDSITSRKGNIILQNATLSVDTLNNTGSTNITVDVAKDASLDTQFINIATNKGAGLKMDFKGRGLDGKSTTEKEKFLKNNVAGITNTDNNFTVSTESKGGDKVEITVDDKGEIVDTVITNNSVTAAISDIASTQMLAWRSQINDVSKRLGDIRTYEGNVGAWARVYGSKAELDDTNVDYTQATVQVGIDKKIGNNFYAGITASYMDGEGRTQNGSTDDASYAFGIYGGWLADNGQFVDVIVKQTKIDTDLKLHYNNGRHTTGSYDTWGTSVAIEAGWRMDLTQTGLWVEPQAEISYGRMQDTEYTTSAQVRTQHDAMDSLVGRFGVAFGKTFDAGSAYVKASVAHDWDGKTAVTTTLGEEHNRIRQDLGGTWGEFSLGGTYRFSKNFAAYGELQTSFGSPVDTPFQWNVGARYSF